MPTVVAKNYTFGLTGCGSVAKNILETPGFPNDYPPDMYCVYQVPIPHGMALKIVFVFARLEISETCE